AYAIGLPPVFAPSWHDGHRLPLKPNNDQSFAFFDGTERPAPPSATGEALQAFSAGVRLCRAGRAARESKDTGEQQRNSDHDLEQLNRRTPDQGFASGSAIVHQVSKPSETTWRERSSHGLLITRASVQ